MIVMMNTKLVKIVDLVNYLLFLADWDF